MKTYYSDTTVSAKTERESSFELLRIIAMYAILISHFATHGKFNYDTTVISIPRLWWYFIEMGGKFGVNIFVMISGYFLIIDKSGLLNLKRILKFWGQVFFYSTAIYLVFTLSGIVEFSVGSFIKSFFPITCDTWGFASTYFVLYLIHPFLNIFLKSLKKIEFQNMLFLLLAIWCLIPTFLSSDFQGNTLLWFITLYSMAAYIRLYGLNRVFNIKHHVFFWAIFTLLRYLSAIIIIVIGTKIPVLVEYGLHFYKSQSILTLFSTLSFFMIFESLNIGHQKGINTVASASFGVYLIHENPFVRILLWTTVFKNAFYQNSILLIPYSVLVSLLVYTVCTLIDLIRQATVEKAFIIIINKYTDDIKSSISVLIQQCKTSLFGDN